MTSAFYVFRLEPAWYKFQALAKPISDQFASRWVPNLWAEESVYPAVAVIATGWKSSCGLLQEIHRRLCFLPSTWEQGSSVVPRSGVGKQKQYTRLGTVGESRPRRGRIDGNAGVIAPPRSVVCRLIGLTTWFARNPTQRRHTAEILGGRWVRCFQFRKEVSSLFVHSWD